MRAGLIAVAIAVAACGPRTTVATPEPEPDSEPDSDSGSGAVSVRSASKPIPPTASRRVQCQQHVHDGLRAVALDIVAAPGTQACVRDAEQTWEDCLDDGERERLARRADQRQVDCERWTPAVAACVLRLPTAKRCTVDALPWREPIDRGAIGPAVAWSIDVEESSRAEPAFAWAADGTLIVSDAGGIRALRDGGELWRGGGGARFLVVGDIVAIAGDKGVSMRDVATGDPRGDTLSATALAAIGDGGPGKLIALAEDGRVFEVTPAVCGKQGCSSYLGALPSDELPDEPVIGVVKAGIVLAGRYQIHVVDRRIKRVVSIVLHDDGADFVAVVAPGHLAVVDGLGAAVLDVAACRKAGGDLFLPTTAYHHPGNKTRRERPKDCSGCKPAPKRCVAYRESVAGAWQVPAPLPGGAIAFNDHGALERTHLVMADGGGWALQTGGHGHVAGDDRAVYSVSLGPDGDGPLELLALDRAAGKAAWRTTLASTPPQLPEYDDSHVVGDGKRVAVRVGDKLYAIDLPPR